ncbi:DNA primase, small subunit OS=Rhodopirellula baltica SWK14 GN=RBSWK_05111 PE=4 SV=1 [Gemmata massiliana]|uniref:DNA primase, small subunit n=1 Tax=Gemmata massiliana TaxID=1210884 RepID=A0A6P2CX65_9BACT|nr:hypothetical protein [Gemmata massiliana]VTR91692.1 DNA primase, small subunit OS=Rhodopirellula baltica SWK14 GN=RBSWK_05111 PE=4 SV=1 [Gemmata massiliana]
MTTFAELRSTEFAFGANCIPPARLVGGFVDGAPNATRHVVSAEALFRAYHECDEVNIEREAFGTVYQYPAAEYGAHVRRAGSPKGYDGPAACCRLVWDIDRPDLGAALADARKLVTYLLDRYKAHAENGLGIYFSGAKGFHVTLVALPGFHPLVHVPALVKLLCLTIARKAGATIDSAVYDRQRLFRLPNTRHPRTGLHKRFLEPEELFRLNADRVRELARNPAGYGVPVVCEDSETLADDWCDAEAQIIRAAPIGVSGVARREAPSSAPTVPKFVRDFIGFGDITDTGRAVTLFRCAAVLSESGTPPAVVRGLLEEPALKSGLDPREVEKQLAAGIGHGGKGRVT